MKHKILTLIIACIVGSTCYARPSSFYYDGVGFEYEDDWQISSSPNGIIGVMEEYMFYISKAELATNATNLRNNDFIIHELEKRSEIILDQSLRLRDKELLYKTEILEGAINGIPVYYVDFKYSRKEYHRYYCFEWNGYIFDIELSGTGRDFYEEFEIILDSFTFTPEARRGRW